nr:CBBY-like protein isoform X2 [Coffea arabica]
MAATATISHSSSITLYSNSQLNTSSVLKNTCLSSTSLVYSSSSTISINSCNTKICGGVTLKSRNGRGGIRGGRLVCLAASSSSAPSVNLPKALMFDCDGVLVDTEKDGHRISFNDTFAEKELGVTWDVDLYGELLKIGGGKERMTAYFNKVGWPEKAPKSEEERKEFIASLHKRKTELFMALIEKKMLPLRPGVAKLIDQALDNGVKVAVCSTSNEKAVTAIVSFLLGPKRAEQIQIYAGDVVPRKKPDPAIYLLASSTLGVDPSSCVVIEDSAIGLAAAKAAGMKCIVTKSGYTAEEDFLNADAVFDCIGDPPEERFDLSFCGSLLEKQYVS